MKCILLIEDDNVLRENTSELLELSDYKVIVAPNGQIGIDMAKTDLPDIVVCDVMMPEVDGYGVLDALSKNENTKQIPFIFLSAKTERKDVRKGMDLGADDYITKPFGEDELINAIESRLAKSAILKGVNEDANKNNLDITNEIETINDFKNYFSENGEILNFDPGATIYTTGDKSNYIYLVKSGIVKCHKLDEQGKELTIALHKKEDLFGYTSFTHNIPFQETATTINKTELIRITKEDFKNVLHGNHNLTFELIQLISDNLTGVKDQLIQMAYSSVSKKTAATLIKFAEKLNRKPEDPIKISRSDLASVAGIATETLIRTMSNFKKEGLIEMDGRNIKIMDLDKLKNIF